jgi:hypothetical protein
MESYLLDWANLLLRWLHVITAIAWVGSSFYFVFLDSSLVPPADEQLKRDGVTGELWAVHGGGFYHPVKYALAPPQLPPHLHWFFWESYSPGCRFALFTVSYLWNASTYLIDKSLMNWSPGAAISVALCFLVGVLVLYDAICQLFGQRRTATRSSARWCSSWSAWPLAGLPLVRRPRGLPAGGRDDRHRHERQRVLLDHPGPEEGDRVDQAASRSTPSTASAASSAACTTRTSRCRCCSRCCPTTTASSTRTSRTGWC